MKLGGRAKAVGVKVRCRLVGWGLLCALVLAGCGTNQTASTGAGQVDRAPVASAKMLARLVALPNPAVKKVTKSKYGNGPVYTVLGKSYRVMDNAQGFRQEGIASWYGAKFHGRKTSSGEVFDAYKLSAAHKHLPLPSFARVTNLANGKQTIVRVNDRGPFHDDRVIDLSYAAAVKLGFHEYGTAKVMLEVVEPAEAVSHYLVQAGEFRHFNQAAGRQTEIELLTDLASIIVKTASGFFKIQMGPIETGAALDRVRAVLMAADVGGLRVFAAP